MNDHSWHREKIRIRDRLRLLGYLAGAAAVVVVVCLLLENGNQKTAAAEMAEAVATQSPALEAAAATPEPDDNGLPKIDPSSWQFVLVNDDHRLDENSAPPKLTVVSGDERVDSRIADQFSALVNAAHTCGYTTYVCSAYRDYQTQSDIYWNHVWDYMKSSGLTQPEAEAKTKLSVNAPGASEHQSGLAIDLLEYQGQDMESYIGGSGLMQWLEDNCCRFGFVVRYPEGKQSVTGVEYEPWHLRYVGEQAATYMMENNLCLEEFLALYEK